MFHKFKAFRVHVKSSLVIPLRVVFVLIGVIFLTDMFEMLSTGVAEYKYSKPASIEDDAFGFFAKLFQWLAITFFCFYMVYAVKGRISDTNNNDNDSRTDE